MKNTLFTTHINYTGNKGTSNLKKSKTDEPEQWYTCPMHPEIKGKPNDKCPQCGMTLTVLVP